MRTIYAVLIRLYKKIGPNEVSNTYIMILHI